MKLYLFFIASMLFFAPHATAADFIAKYCRKPNAESILTREPAQTYEYTYWVNGTQTIQKGHFTVENNGRLLRFSDTPLEQLGPGYMDAGGTTITFQFRTKNSTQVVSVQFSKSQCPWWPGR